MFYTLATQVVYNSVEALLVAIEALYASAFAIKSDVESFTGVRATQVEIGVLKVDNGIINIYLGENHLSGVYG